MTAPLLPTPYRVGAVRQETAEAATFVLEGDVADATPGQFNMLYPFGVGEAAISLCACAPEGRLAHTVRSVGAVSEALRRLRPGDWIGVRGPFGTGWPMAAARDHDVVLVAGGIGLAPLRPAVEAICAERARFGRVLLLYGARSPADRLYRDDLERWAERIDVAVTVDYAEPGWTGHVGFVTALLAKLRVAPSRTLAFVCGPEIMIRTAADALVARGVPAAAVHISLERNMKCAVATCGHCQFGSELVCRDGPVVPYARVAAALAVREL